MKKIFLPGIIAALASILVSMVVSWIFNMFFPWLEEAYKNTAMFRPMDDPLMFGFFLQPFFQCVVFAWAWDKFKEHFAGSVIGSGFKFGFFLWIIATIPGMMMSYFGFNITLTMISSWTISNLATFIVSGWIFAAMNKNS